MTAVTGRPGADAPAARTGHLTRITLSGARRRADLVLPSDEPLGLLVPDLVAMVGGRSGGDPGGYQLTTVDGTALDVAATLRQCGVVDGTMVRLDPITDAPPAPILHDVADHVSDDVDGLRGRWDATSLRWTATAAAVAGAVVAAWIVGPVIGPVVTAAAAVAAAAAGTALAWWGSRRVGVAVLLGGAGIALVAVPSATALWPLRAMLAALVVALVVGLLGAATGQVRTGLMGGGTLLVQLALWWAFGVAGLPAVQGAAVLAVLAVGVLGLLPSLAVTASGLAGLDDRQVADEPVTRVAAAAAVCAAHHGLALACVATAVSGGVAGWVLAVSGSGWSTVLAFLVGAALLLRLRAFPLTVEVVALVAAALAVGAGLLLHWMEADADLPWAGAAVALAVSAVALLALTLRPQPHVRARARQLADRVEGIVIVVSVPVAVGVFGVYERLLETF